MDRTLAAVIFIIVAVVGTAIILQPKQGETMGKKGNKRKAQAIEAEIVGTVAEIEGEKVNKLFNFGTLNIHLVQTDIWGETKQGKPFTLQDFELQQLVDNNFFISKKLGESVVGRMYEITDAQLKATDSYEGKGYTRIEVEQDGETFSTYVLSDTKAK